MASEVANFALNTILSAQKDSGMGLVKESVNQSGLGMSKSGGTTRYYHDDGAVLIDQRIDLNDGTLKDAFGYAIAFITLYALYIKNNTGGTIEIGANGDGAPDHPITIFETSASDRLSLVDGGTFLYMNPTGLTLTPGVSDAFGIEGTAGDCDIIIVGATA